MTTTAKPGTDQPPTSGIRDSWTVTAPMNVVTPAARAVWTSVPRMLRSGIGYTDRADPPWFR